MVVEKQIFAKELDMISHNAAPDKIFKADIICYSTLNVFTILLVLFGVKMLRVIILRVTIANELL